MEQLSPIPPKAMMKARSKSAPFWHHWNGWRGGRDVPFILSKIVVFLFVNEITNSLDSEVLAAVNTLEFPSLAFCGIGLRTEKSAHHGKLRKLIQQLIVLALYRTLRVVFNFFTRHPPKTRIRPAGRDYFSTRSYAPKNLNVFSCMYNGLQSERRG